jgi:dTDP-4-amino-4,6-dideoxygalactose transaminase
VGSFGNAAAFSFCNDKIISSFGEGGMLTTNSSEVWERASAFRDHGANHEASAQPANGYGFRWIHDSIGTNWRMPEAQAAVGRIQLKKASSWLHKRRALARILRDRLSRIPALRVPSVQPHIEPAYYRFYAFVRPEKLGQGWDRDMILHAVSEEGVTCFGGSCGEVYLEKAFATWRPAFRHPVARELGETSLAFPVHPTLAETDIEDICCAAEKVMACAT